MSEYSCNDDYIRIKSEVAKLMMFDFIVESHSDKLYTKNIAEIQQYISKWVDKHFPSKKES